MSKFTDNTEELDLMDEDVLEDEHEDEHEDRGDDLNDEQKAEQDDDFDDDDDEESIDADDEDDNQDESDDDADANADADASAKGSRVVPHSRFNEVNEQYKQERDARLRLEEELARLRGASPVAPSDKDETPPAEGAFDFDAADEQYTQAIYDGEIETAKSIRAEIRKQERLSAQSAAEEVVRQRDAESAQERQSQEIQSLVSKAIKSYPFLDAQSPDANQHAIDVIVAMRNVYINQGMTPVEAITKAVEDEAPRFADDDVKATQSLTAKRKASINRSLSRSKRIPATDTGVGERSRKTDYSALSQGEFRSLSEDEKKKARGDYL